MKDNYLWVWVFLFPVILFAQEEKDSTTVEMEKLSADFSIGREFNFGKSSVNFIKVISDSRCPRKVTCIWPGEARILLGIEINGEYFEEEVVLSSSGAEIPLANELLLQVSHLRPYPETGAKIAAEEYCLSISAIFPAVNQ